MRGECHAPRYSSARGPCCRRDLDRGRQAAEPENAPVMSCCHEPRIVFGRQLTRSAHEANWASIKQLPKVEQSPGEQVPAVPLAYPKQPVIAQILCLPGLHSSGIALIWVIRRRLTRQFWRRAGLFYRKGQDHGSQSCDCEGTSPGSCRKASSVWSSAGLSAS